MLEIFVIDLRTLNPDDVILCEERREKLKRLKMPHSRLEAIGAEVAMNMAVRHFYPDAPLPLRYFRNEHGKPYLTDYPDLFINVSHSGDFAVCVASDTEVGIDIQKIRTANFRIAQRYFTKEECDFIGSDNLRFFDLWSRKESYVKATGTGITVPLNSFSVLCDTDKYRFIPLTPPTDEYVMCVCKFNE